MIGFMDVECSIGVIKLDLDQVRQENVTHGEDTDMIDDIDVGDLDDLMS